MSIHRFSFPTSIHFGPGARKLVGGHLRDLDLRRPLIVTDRGLAALPVLSEFIQHLADDLETAVYSGVHGNPSASQVKEGVAAFNSHEADCVVGFGGGAALDVAKVVAAMAVHSGDVIEYVGPSAGAAAGSSSAAVFALPTTSGTGSRSAARAVVSRTTHVKRVIFSPKLLALAVFADPELTLGLRRLVTAATGMDADAQHRKLPVAGLPPAVRRHRAQGVRIAARALPVAVRDGRNLRPHRHDDGVDDGRDRIPEGSAQCIRVPRPRGHLRPAPRAGKR
jgi:alcohol dehydrogenase class IV